MNYPATVSNVAAPRAELSCVLPERVVALDAELAPHARTRESAQPVLLPPKSALARIQRVADVAPPSVPGFPLCAMGPPPDCAAVVSKAVEPARWWNVEFEIGRRRYDLQ